MAGTNVGNLNATLSLSAFEFNAGLKQSETAAIEFATTTEVQAQRANAALNGIGRGSSGSIAGKTAGVVQQVGFAMQDFSSQISTRGIGPAIGAVTNNVQMLGMAFGPIPAAIGAVGGALAGILLPRLIESGSLFGKTAEEMAAFEKKVHDLSEKTFAPWREMENTKFDLLKGSEKQLDDRLGTMRHKMGMLEQEARAEKVAAERTDSTTQTGRDEFAVRKKRIDELMKQWTDMQKQGQAFSALRPQIKEREAFDKGMEDSSKKQQEMYKAEANIKKKSLEQYGTEAMKVEARIARERKELADQRVNEETQKRFESMSKIDLARARVTDAEKKLSEMGQAAGMSAGVQRNTSAGISAINRAVAGTQSEQSMQKQQVDSLKRLVKLAEDEAAKPRTKVVALSGGAA